MYPNRWELPGGKLEENESVKQCALREFFEETGIKATFTHQKPVRMDSYVINTPTGSKSYHQKIYLVQHPEGTPKVTLSKEHSEFAWITHQNLHEYDFLPGVKEDIKAAFKKFFELQSFSKK